MVVKAVDDKKYTHMKYDENIMAIMPSTIHTISFFELDNIFTFCIIFYFLSSASFYSSSKLSHTLAFGSSPVTDWFPSSNSICEFWSSISRLILWLGLLMDLFCFLLFSLISELASSFSKFNTDYDSDDDGSTIAPSTDVFFFANLLLILAIIPKSKDFLWCDKSNDFSLLV